MTAERLQDAIAHVQVAVEIVRAALESEPERAERFPLEFAIDGLTAARDRLESAWQRVVPIGLSASEGAQS